MSAFQDSAGRIITVSYGTAEGGSPDTVQGDVASNAADSGNPVKVGGVYNSLPTVLTEGDRGQAQLNAYGSWHVQLTDNFQNRIQATLGNADGQAAFTYRLDVAAAGYVYNGTSWDRQRGDTTGTHVVAKPGTSGGLSSFRVVTGTTGVIKASPGQLYCLVAVRNANAAVRYLHLYNKATAPTLSTDTPILTIPLLASSILSNIDLTTIGSEFPLGIAWAYTTDNIAIPATAATSGELMFSGGYK